MSTIVKYTEKHRITLENRIKNNKEEYEEYNRMINNKIKEINYIRDSVNKYSQQLSNEKIRFSKIKKEIDNYNDEYTNISKSMIKMSELDKPDELEKLQKKYEKIVEKHKDLEDKYIHSECNCLTYYAWINSSNALIKHAVIELKWYQNLANKTKNRIEEFEIAYKICYLDIQ